MIKTRYLFGLPMITFSIGSIEIEGIIDTGFNGSFLLPKDIIKQLGLPKLGTFKTILADGSTVNTDAFMVQTNWFGKQQIVDVISSNSDIALVGMELLQDLTTTLSPNKDILTLTSL